MSHHLRSISLERDHHLAEELRSMQLPVEGWRDWYARQRRHAISLEDLSEDEAASLSREAQSEGVHVFLARQTGARRRMLLLGERHRFEALQGRCAAQRDLAGIADELRGCLQNLLQTSYRLRCRSHILELGRRILLMGVLNVTPDSFSDGGRFLEADRGIAHGQRLIEEGADILDIGGESSRPGAHPIPPEEELRRILPPLRALAKAGIPISVDTHKAEVARVALEEGASLINDISALRLDPGLAEVVANAGAGLVLMHMKGTPRDMQKDPHYDSLMGEVVLCFREAILQAESAGVHPEAIVLDPGLGFGKTFEHNLILLRRLSELRCLGKPILLGPSRKSFTGKLLNLPPEERLESTAAAVAWGAIQGASLIRVHDVKEMRRVTVMIDALRDGP